MSLPVHCLLPTAGDSREIVGFGPTVGRRPADIVYLALIAQAADKLGFEAVLTPTLAAQQAATFRRFSGGRLILNIVTGGEAEEQRRIGDWPDHDRRYDCTAEFLIVLHVTAGLPRSEERRVGKECRSR